jgi:hypothetical protein
MIIDSVHVEALLRALLGRSCATAAAAAGQGRVELLTGIEWASSRPVRKIVVVAEC